MAWLKLDDQFPVNTKARAAGLEGRMLYITSLCWCAMQMNDGEVPTSDLQAVASLADVPQAVGERLIEVGLWHREGDDCDACADAGQRMPVPSGCITVHGYLERNKSRQQVIAEREKDRSRKRRPKDDEQSDSDSGQDSERNPPGESGRNPAPPSSPVPSSDGFSSLQSSTGLGTQADPVDNPTTTDGETPAAANGHVPDEVWDEYAQLKLARQKNVKNPGPWKTKTAENAQLEHADQAAAWWHKFDVTPAQLAAWLIDGQVSPHARLRPQEPA